CASEPPARCVLIHAFLSPHADSSIFAALDPSVREYWDLKAELEADDAERSKGESILEDTQILLGLTISEHKQLKQSEIAAGA
ncbi:hypothetical protein C8R46DRAFT_1192525, partial [Mycena filopes]